MREVKTFAQYTLQPAEVPEARREVLEAEQKVLQVRHICHHKIDSEYFEINHYLSPFKKGV